MDTFVDSSWYFLRYISPHDDRRAFDPALVDQWLPVDQYIGGIEHAILHLLYSRYIVKFLYDRKLVSFEEPFGSLFTQGMITRNGAKMSKSAGNTVDPKPLIEKYGADTVESETMTLITQTLKDNFTFNIWLLLPMAIVFYFAATKKPTIPGMLLSSFVAGILAVIFQKASVAEIAAALNTGYQANTGVAQVDELISRGGMMSMMETQLVAFTAFSFGGIMQRTGLLSVILEKVMLFANKVWSIVLTTIATSIVTALVTGSSYLSMIIPGELLAPIYKKKNLAAKNLSRIIEESGAIIVPLIPWSMAGVYITGTIGVSTFSYLPWAIMNYTAVFILAVFGFTKFTMSPKIREDETQIGS